MEKIVAVGAGRMGRGIAHVMAYAGYEVTLVDMKARPAAAALQLATEARAEIQGNLRSLAGTGLLDAADVDIILNRIGYASLAQADAVLASADVVFEGVPEVMETKAQVLAHISRRVRADALIASTTSTFSADTLSEHVHGAERFLNAHWLNPAFLIPVVEVSPTRVTSESAVERLFGLLKSAGKLPVRCKASPGFIVPRIQALAMNEAARLVEDGVATVEDIDTATRYGFGVRFAVLGLLEFIDYGGGDILYYASRYLSDALGSERHAAPTIVNDMMARGERGLRDGKGFYDYADRDVPAYQRETLHKLVDLLQHLGLVSAPHLARTASDESQTPPQELQKGHLDSPPGRAGTLRQQRRPFDAKESTPMPIKTRYLFTASMDVDPAHEALFNEVYDTEHVPCLLKVPGVLAVSRYTNAPLKVAMGGEVKTIVAEGEPKYHATYEIESPEVLTSKAWADAIEEGRWPEQVRPHTRNRRHTLKKLLD